MPLHQVGPIFQGVTPSGMRKAYKTIISAWQDEYDHFVEVCAGNLCISEAWVGAGIDPTKIVCSDIALHSAVIGYCCDPTKSVSSLGFKCVGDETLELLEGLPQEDDFQYGASICVVQKWVQLQGKSDFLRWQRIELQHQKEAVHARYHAALTAMHAKLGGLTYEIRDAHAHINEYRDNPRAAIWYNPPAYSGGYTKMYDPKGHYEWDEPNIPELNLEDVAEFIDGLVEIKCQFALGCQESYPISCFDDDSPWHKWFVEPLGKAGTKWYAFGNREIDHTFLQRPPLKGLPSKIMKIYDDHEITEDSVIGMKFVTKELALYYYDLFVRDLGMSAASEYYLFVIDGQVAGTCGFDDREILMHRSHILYQTFGLTLTSTRYARLSRLMNRYVTSSEFINQFSDMFIPDKSFVNRPTVMQTTALSKNPVLMAYRGIFKKISMKTLKNGRYHLIYQGKIHDKTMSEVMAEWVKKHSAHSRTKGVVN